MDPQHARPWQLGAGGRWLLDLALAGGPFVVGGLGQGPSSRPSPRQVPSRRC